jgi:ADP-ribose pyrophosphatase
MRPWKTLSRHTILSYSKFLTIESHTLELPNGQMISDWAWVITPDYVNVLAVTNAHTFLCFRQVKYGVEGSSLAPVGGMLEPGEAPLSAAQRELFEETGYQAAQWIDLGHYRTDANRGMGTGYLFLAQGAHFVGDTTSDDLEEQQLLHLGRAEIQAALLAGEFKVLSWATTIALALLHLQQEQVDINGGE